MTTQRSSSRPAPLPPRLESTTLPGRRNYRHVEAGVVLSIKGQPGRYRVKYINQDGTLTCWGGRVGFYSMRTFRPEDVATVHRGEDL